MVLSLGRRPIVKICKINSHGFTSKMEKMETVQDTDDETTFHLQQAELTEKEEIAGPGNGKSYASDHTENSTQNPYGVHVFVRIYVYGVSLFLLVVHKYIFNKNSSFQ